MKTPGFPKTLAVAAAGSLALLALNAPAQNTTDPTAPIRQLEQAKVSDDTIIAYIKNSGSSYNLNADQIISLHQQGISDAVITAMLSQPRPGAAPATVSTPATPAPQVYSTTPPGTTDTTQPTATYDQTVPTTYYYYYAQPYYYYYPAFYSPICGYYGWRRCLASFCWNGRRGGNWHGGAAWNGNGNWHGNVVWNGGGMHGSGMMHNGGNWHGGAAWNSGSMMHGNAMMHSGGGWHR